MDDLGCKFCAFLFSDWLCPRADPFRMTPGRTGCCGLLVGIPEPDLLGLVWSVSGRSRSSEDSLLLLLGIVISSDGSSCVDGPPIAFGATKTDAALFGLLVVGSRSLFEARRM